MKENNGLEKNPLIIKMWSKVSLEEVKIKKGRILE